MNPLTQFKTITLPSVIAVGLGLFALSFTVQAVSPPPDGLYPGANTAEGGAGALFNLTTGSNNTAIGNQALFSLTTGIQNTAVGAGALKSNTADGNTAIGFGALVKNTVGSSNTATGWRALSGNIYGYANTAQGSGALFLNIDGNDNTAVGFNALTRNNGSDNVAVGGGALQNNATGSHNTAIGDGALWQSRTGRDNIALGALAGGQIYSASNVICIGAFLDAANVSNTTWIKNIYGVATQNGTTAPVIVSADGQLGTIASSERFKKDIATMQKASEAVLSLRPVTFHYKTDTTGTPQFGLIAEEVAKVNPALVLPDKEGKPYTVRYDAVNAMLLNEFLKEHRKVEQMQKQIDALAAVVQKVSAQLELSKPAPQTVLNDQ